ncbi:type II toxin-antitoxin system VapC family toxin [Thiolapillus sp.]
MIPSGSRILLDTVTLIYFLENHKRHGHQAERVLSRIESGDLKGMVSDLLFAELLVPLYREGKDTEAARLVTLIRNFNNLETVAVSWEISARAARLRALHGLRTPDAIHAATALASGADGILTNDHALTRLEVEGLSIWQFDTIE